MLIGGISVLTLFEYHRMVLACKYMSAVICWRFLFSPGV